MDKLTVSQCVTADWCRGYNAAVEKANKETNEWKNKFLESETDATNLTGELVTVSAENEDLKQEVKYLHDVIADYDDCCRKRACPQMEKLKQHNEQLKRFLKSKIKVYGFKEDHDGCIGCVHVQKYRHEMPCCKCKGVVSPLSEEYKTRKDYWRSC